MLSSTLVQLIEDHSDSITAEIVREFRHDARLPHVGSLPEADVRERSGEILKHLGHWLTVSGGVEVARRFERIGGERCAEGIPLHEVVLAYLIVKRRMIDFARRQGLGETAMAIYAEEELENSIDRFFDSITYHMVKGYEEALGGRSRPMWEKAKAGS